MVVLLVGDGVGGAVGSSPLTDAVERDVDDDFLCDLCALCALDDADDAVVDNVDDDASLA